MFVVFIFACLLLSYPTQIFAQQREDTSKKELLKHRFLIRLRSSSQLTLKVRRDKQGRPVLVGKLMDDRDKLIPNKLLILKTPDHRTHTLKTNKHGYFRKLAIGFFPKGSFMLSFRGDQQFASTSTKRKLDLGKIDLNLRLWYKKKLYVGTQEIKIKAKLSFHQKPLKGIPLSLFLRKPNKVTKEPILFANKNSLWPLILMTFQTDQNGTLKFIWKGKPLKNRGIIPLLIRYSGNRFFLPQEKNILIKIIPYPQSPKKPIFPLRYLWILLFVLLIVILIFLRYHKKHRDIADKQKKDNQPTSVLYKTSDLNFDVNIQIPSDDFILEGVVLDAQTRKPIKKVRLWHLTNESLLKESKKLSKDEITEKGEMVYSTGLKGEFHWEGKEAKKEIFYFTHPHYEMRTTNFTIPHHGQGRNLRIYLVSYRYLIFEIYRKAVGTLASKQLFDPRRTTARELLAQLPPEIAQQLMPLARYFEKSYYSPKMPDQKMYQDCLELLQTFMDKKKN